MVSLSYDYEAIITALNEQGILLLPEFLSINEEKLLALPLKESYKPLHHKWSAHSGDALDKVLAPLLAKLSGIATFRAELLVLSADDYSIVHDDDYEEGLVGFLPVGSWNYDDGGYLGVDHEPILLAQNTLLLVQGRFRWFIKKIRPDTTKKRVVIVLRAEE